MVACPTRERPEGSESAIGRSEKSKFRSAMVVDRLGLAMRQEDWPEVEGSWTSTLQQAWPPARERV